MASRSTVFSILLLSICYPSVAVTVIAQEPLAIATSGDYPPFSIENAEGDISGFDLAVAYRLGEDLGRSLDIETFDWAELNDRLRAGQIDIVMSGITVRADRALLAHFSRPYAVTGAVAVIRPADRERYPNLEALDQLSVRIGVNAGGHLEHVARKRFPNARLVLMSNNRVLAELLRQNAVHAVISESFEARTWGDDLVVLGPFTRDRKAYAIPLAKRELLEQVDSWLAAREADGWLNEQRQQWLGKAAEWTPAQACREAVIGDIDLRLQLMPWVAAAKRSENIPVHDPIQEQKVLGRARELARAAHLEPASVGELFRVQIGLARSVQENAPAAMPPKGTTLNDLREVVGGVSEQLIAELARCTPLFKQQSGRNQLAADIRAGTTTVGVPATAAGSLATALSKVRTLNAARRSTRVSAKPASRGLTRSLNTWVTESLNRQPTRSLNQISLPQGKRAPAPR